MELSAFVPLVRKVIRQPLVMLNALTVLPTLAKILLMEQNANVTLVITLLLEVLVNVQNNVMLLEVLKQKTPKINVFVKIITLELNAILVAHGQTWEQHQIRVLPQPLQPVLVVLITMELNAKLNAKTLNIKKLTVLKPHVNVKILIGKL